MDLLQEEDEAVTVRKTKTHQLELKDEDGPVRVRKTKTKQLELGRRRRIN